MLYLVAKILVVDDEESLTEILNVYLSAEGHEVVVCHDSSAAAGLALEIKPDIALLDYQMPRRTGVQLIAELRAREETRLLPVLLLSGTEAVRFAGQIPPEPRVRFLVKPVDMDILMTMIREMLDPNSWSARR